MYVVLWKYITALRLNGSTLYPLNHAMEFVLKSSLYIWIWNEETRKRKIVEGKQAVSVWLRCVELKWVPGVDFTNSRSIVSFLTISEYLLLLSTYCKRPHYEMHIS